jgi:hypothetical protein
MLSDFDDGTTGGWASNSGSVLITSSNFDSAIHATTGTNALNVFVFPPGGFQWAMILDNNDVPNLKNLIVANPILEADVSWKTSEWSFDPDGSWARWDQISLNTAATGALFTNDSHMTDSANPSFPGSWDQFSWGATHKRTIRWNLSSLIAGYESEILASPWVLLNMAINFDPAFDAPPGYSFWIDSIRLVPVPLTGDYNYSGVVDAADYVAWRKDPANFGGSGGYATWRSQFGAGTSGPPVTAVTNIDQAASATLSANGDNWAAASSFTTGDSTYVLDSITVSAQSSTGGTSELRIRADGGGMPGTLLGTFGSQSILEPALVTFNSGSTSVLLAPFTRYWITLGETGSGDFGWNATLSASEASTIGWTIGDLVYQKQTGSGTWQNFGPPNYAGLFSVTAHSQGAGSAATIPEPAAVTLLLIACLSNINWRRRRTAGFAV